MNKNEFYYLSADGKTQIHAVEWIPDVKPKAILQIAHGVTEYILRYEQFAEYLVEKIHFQVFGRPMVARLFI